MGKHERGYPRAERDFYPTPEWVTDQLLEAIQVPELVSVWEPAAGEGHIVKVLQRRGLGVWATDIQRHAELDNLTDFLTDDGPECSAIITNPPFGERGRLAVEFIKKGLHHIRAKRCKMLALLLPADFDSAGGRREFFGSCPEFSAKLVLTRRIIWFRRQDGVTEAPKENHAWFIWHHTESAIMPVLLYSSPSPASLSI